MPEGMSSGNTSKVFKSRCVRYNGELVSARKVVRCNCFFFSSRRRHTRYWRDWSSDVCSSDLPDVETHVPVGGDGGEQVFDTFQRRAAGTEEILPQIIVDTGDLPPVPGKQTNAG